MVSTTPPALRAQILASPWARWYRRGPRTQPTWFFKMTTSPTSSTPLKKVGKFTKHSQLCPLSGIDQRGGRLAARVGNLVLWARSALTATQILVINILMDGPPAVAALGVEKKHGNAHGATTARYEGLQWPRYLTYFLPRCRHGHWNADGVSGRWRTRRSRTMHAEPRRQAQRPLTWRRLAGEGCR